MSGGLENLRHAFCLQDLEKFNDFFIGGVPLNPKPCRGRLLPATSVVSQFAVPPREQYIRGQRSHRPGVASFAPPLRLAFLSCVDR